MPVSTGIFQDSPVCGDQVEDPATLMTTSPFSWMIQTHMLLPKSAPDRLNEF
jgi:hypothetical protein